MAGRINDRELITLAVVFLLCTFSGAEAKGHHEVPTYFKRINHDGSLVDAANPQTRVKFLHSIQSDFSSGTTLEVNPSVVENGATVNVSWSGIQQPNETDFVAFYCPKDDPFDHYLDYFYVTESPSYVSGFGCWQVTVYNMRTSCEFRYYHKSYIHIATSNVLKFKGGIYAPLQGHLALTGDPTQMRVMWVSGTGPGKRKGFSSFKVVDRSNKTRKSTVQLPSTLPLEKEQHRSVEDVEQGEEEEDPCALCDGDPPDSDDDVVPTSSTSSYKMRKERLHKNWESLRSTLLKFSVEMEGFVPHQCNCGKTVESRCRDCSFTAYFCLDCCNHLHQTKHHFHHPEIIQDGVWKLHTVPDRTLSNPYHSC